ncbi:MAG: thiamine pyrophosphate-dependent enzyme, partial [Pseudomonadota bacterium]
DDPTFTQPLMYKTIKDHPTTLQIYAAQLAEEGLVTEAETKRKISDFRTFLEEEFTAASTYRPNQADWLAGRWAGLALPQDDDRRGETAVPLDRLHEVGKALTTYPEGFNAHKTIKRILKTKAKMFETGEGFDWATAEALAFGSLLKEGFPVRLSGQDSGRGTFSQRHSVFVDQETEAQYRPLNNIASEQAAYEVIDTMLSEFAVLGFEYGYTLAEPNALVLWEAQFGDFANGAQIMIDQFISSGEKKWLRMCGLVLLLPHGYEGQGPEHSSARLERFLQMCAEDNMQVANCTSPANYFHILRRQMHRDFRKPLVLMTPKSLLRHKRCVSTLDEMGPGSSFHRVLWDDAEYKPGSTITLKPDDQIRRVLMCTGKVYYDLLEEREAREVDDIYILRLEQLYPFPAKSLVKELGRFKNAEMLWVQEEPRNMGSWSFVEPNIEWVLTKIGARYGRARYVGRHAAASPATGLMRKHQSELEGFLNEALTLDD